MTLLLLERSDYFWADLECRVDWYRDHAGPEIAERFVSAAQSTLTELCETPGLGRPRFKTLPELSGICSFPIQRPFHRHLIFYRYDASSLFAERLVHGARDLPRRLIHPPFEK